MTALTIPDVSAVAKANVYFDGKVISHTLISADGTKRTLGLIFPGSYHFTTDAAEVMEIVAGSCTVTLDGESDDETYEAGGSFEVPAHSGFTIAVTAGLCEYICLFVA